MSCHDQLFDPLLPSTLSRVDLGEKCHDGGGRKQVERRADEDHRQPIVLVLRYLFEKLVNFTNFTNFREF